MFQCFRELKALNVCTVIPFFYTQQQRLMLECCIALRVASSVVICLPDRLLSVLCVKKR